MNDPQVGDEVLVRGTITQRAIDTLGRDICQITIDEESYFFIKTKHVIAKPKPPFATGAIPSLSPRNRLASYQSCGCDRDDEHDWRDCPDN